MMVAFIIRYKKFRDVIDFSCLMGFGSGVTNSNAFYGFGFMTIINRDKASMRMNLRAPAAKVVRVERGGVLPKAC